MDSIYAEGTWHGSYEASQHAKFLGISDEPVCHILSGYASGFMTAVAGRPMSIYQGLKTDLRTSLDYISSAMGIVTELDEFYASERSAKKDKDAKIVIGITICVCRLGVYCR